MPAQQPTLDGTMPAPALDYQTWADLVEPTFITVARTDREWTSYEIAHEYGLPEPPKPESHWGSFVHRLARRGVIEHCGWDETSRPTGEHSGVKVWRGTRAAQAGRVA